MTMTGSFEPYDRIENGLKTRGFTGIEGMDSMGECHKNEKHYILRTDGLIIYSDVPFWTDHRDDPNVRYEIWAQEKYEGDDTPVFTFKALDKIMKERVLPNKYVDPKTVKIVDHVNNGQKVHFQYFRDDEFWYKTDAGLMFPVSLKEAQAGKATFLAEDKALYFMRWIKKYVQASQTESERPHES